MTDQRLRDYRAGLKDMATWLAVWHDGMQLVGVQAKRLAAVHDEIDVGKWDYVNAPPTDAA